MLPYIIVNPEKAWLLVLCQEPHVRPPVTYYVALCTAHMYTWACMNAIRKKPHLQKCTEYRLIYCPLHNLGLCDKLIVFQNLFWFQKLFVLFVCPKQPIPPQESAGIISIEVLMVEVMETCSCVCTKKHTVTKNQMMLYMYKCPGNS